MPNAINFDPMLTTAPQNTFQVDTQGYVQGVTFDDASSRQWLNSGLISSANTTPMWGGMAIEEILQNVNSNGMGPEVAIAPSNPDVTGFSVFDQAYNMVIVPGGGPPLGSTGMTVNFYRLGSNARIAVQCSPALAAALAAGPINQQVSWDFVNQMLIAYNATVGALPVKVLQFSSQSKIVSYNSTTNVASWAVGAAAIIQI